MTVIPGDYATDPDLNPHANTWGDDHSAGSTEIPDFEGEPVLATKAKVTSAANLELNDTAYRMDQVVRMVVECKVVGIEHKSNARGELERIHTLKAVDNAVIPYELDLSAYLKGSVE